MIETKNGLVKAIGTDDEILADIGAIIDAVADHWEVSIGDLLWTISAMTYECMGEGEGSEDEREIPKERDREEVDDFMQRQLRSRGSHYRRW